MIVYKTRNKYYEYNSNIYIIIRHNRNEISYCDIKFKLINFYGYVKYNNVGDYKYKSQNIAFSNYNNKLYNITVNITMYSQYFQRTRSRTYYFIYKLL